MLDVKVFIKQKFPFITDADLDGEGRTTMYLPDVVQLMKDLQQTLDNGHVIKLRKLLVKMQKSLNSDLENSDLIKSYRKKCKIDIEFITRAIQLIDVFQPTIKEYP